MKGSRKTAKSNIRHNSKHINFGSSSKSKSQRRVVPVINPITLHQPDFHKSGVGDDKYSATEKGRKQAERAIQIKNSRISIRKQKAKKYEAPKVGFYVFPF
mmetsp:Transcript_25305/g.28060  ORF Transcript_25305/g.28060 Transcript_25305/m.28060 type:complete len:101 (+) Transcript_25305:361-663(+)